MRTKGSKKTGGRTKGARNKITHELRTILFEEVDFRVVVQKVYELVKGVKIQTNQPQAGNPIYEKPPNHHAARLLLEYGYGKVTQHIQMDASVSNDSLPILDVNPIVIDTVANIVADNDSSNDSTK